MPYRLALDQKALHAIHDVRTWAYALVDAILGNTRGQSDWPATTLQRIGRLCPMTSSARPAMSPRDAADTTCWMTKATNSRLSWCRT